MAIVFLALGAFIYLRFEADLSAAIDRGLRSRFADLSDVLRENDGRLAEGEQEVLTERSDALVQILRVDGRIVDATAGLGTEPLLDRAQLGQARSEPLILERRNPLEPAEPTRFFASTVSSEGRLRYVVVGTDLEERDQALSSLGAILLLGGPAGVLLACIAGYLLAAAALRPVEAMRRRAESVTERHPERRLPLPDARDELRLLAATLNAMLDRLDTALARERNFVADASHELRTPLAALKAEVEVALDSDGDREELRAALVSADVEVDRLAQLAEDLLVIARSERGQLPVRREPIAAQALLERLRTRFERRLSESGRALIVDGPPELWLDVDPLRMEQALGNLVDNAIRHAQGEIRCQAIELDGEVELHVSDDGPGLSDELAAVAFERFTRGDPSRARGGAGLGLAIVEVIANAHGGGVRLDSSGKGTDVVIVLPARVAAQPDRSRDQAGWSR
jgi:heavy metal sensor kinase